MKTGEARIVSMSNQGVRMCAAAARISTTEGGAVKAMEKGDGAAKDLRLIGKVISSGHKTILEHQSFTIAFKDVSVLAEQCLIEFRLASYTVKSRRYVDFSGAGYIVPEGMTKTQEALFRKNMDARFEDYGKLLELGIPREDARFVLPYCFKSNFYMTLNARELAHVIGQMRYGRLSRYPELVKLGEDLDRQLSEIMPDTGNTVSPKAAKTEITRYEAEFKPLSACVSEASLISKTENAKEMLESILALTDRFPCENTLRALTRDARARELEFLNYAFLIKNVSLSCVTHFARHRMQSLIVPFMEQALFDGGHIVPQNVKNNAEAMKIYVNAFADNRENALQMRSLGFENTSLAYFALSGSTVNILLGMNGRELLHFMKLRTCTRAQWEIREIASDMLSLLYEEYPALFRNFGPSCAVTGACPEGRLSCGRIQKTEA